MTRIGVRLRPPRDPIPGTDDECDGHADDGQPLEAILGSGGYQVDPGDQDEERTQQSDPQPERQLQGSSSAAAFEKCHRTAHGDDKEDDRDRPEGQVLHGAIVPAPWPGR